MSGVEADDEELQLEISKLKQVCPPLASLIDDTCVGLGYSRATATTRVL